MGKWHHVEACLPDDCEGKHHIDHCQGKSPPVFILFVTLLELGFFVYYSALAAGSSAGPAGVSVSSPVSVSERPPVTWDLTSARAVTPVTGLTSLGAVPLDSALVYRPDRSWQLWRLVTYMVLHTSWWHLSFNLLVQLVAGLSLEAAHGSARVAAVYLAGGLAGSLATSVCDAGRQVYLVGASGGVYALLTAHIANVMLNCSHMELGLPRLLAVLLIAAGDAALALYRRYGTVLPPVGPAVLPPVAPAVSYAAHLAGAVAGLSVGLLVLRDFSPAKQRRPLVRWLGLSVLAGSTLFTVIFHILYADNSAQLV